MGKPNNGNKLKKQPLKTAGQFRADFKFEGIDGLLERVK
jgi:hypothetical protein